MSVESVLAAGRRASAVRMLSRATVRRQTGAMTRNERGLEVSGWQDVYVGRPCRVAGVTRGQSPSKTLEIGGAEVQVATRTVHFPHDTTDLRDGDLVEITEGELAGTVWRIVEADAADQQTARRVPAVSANRPEEWP